MHASACGVGSRGKNREGHLSVNPESASGARGASENSAPKRHAGSAVGRRKPKRPQSSAVGSLGSRLLLVPQAVSKLDARTARGEVRVEAVGLNFFDLVQVLGAMPSFVAGQFARGHQHSVGIGCDFAGALRAGDPVFGLAGSPGTLAELLPNIPTSALRPKGVSSEEAAALPAVFLTAKAALNWARLCCGEFLLLHAASGGAGLALLAAARRCGLGAGILATAGSSKKQCLLRLRGICHVTSSRESRASSADLRWAMGEFDGFTLVVNCLTHDDYVPRGLSLAAPGGRFLELSKVKARLGAGPGVGRVPCWRCMLRRTGLVNAGSFCLPARPALGGAPHRPAGCGGAPKNVSM